MSPEERELLNQSLELSKENNKMLHMIRRYMRLARFMSVIYWVFIIGSAVGAYYFIQPYVEKIYTVYGGAKSNLDNISNLLQGFKQ